MASVKIILRKKANSEGLYPLAIRIIKDRKASFVFTGQYISEKDWDEKEHKVKKSHPNSSRLNNYLAQKYAEANDALIETETKDENVTAKKISRQVKRVNKRTTVFEVGAMYLNTLEKTKKFTRLSADKPRINILGEFFKTEQVYFEELNEATLNRFKTYLKSTRNISDRTIVNYLVVIRSLFSLAIKEGLVDAKHYPFGKDKIKIKFPESIKLGLTREEVKALEDFPLEPNKPSWHARNAWLFSFYFAGMRVSDVLQMKWSDINDNRLTYRMGKNNKTLSLKVPEKALNIIMLYKQGQRNSDDYIFPYLKTVKNDSPATLNGRIHHVNKKLNKHLKNLSKDTKIYKVITMHIARHTFGNISGDRIPIQMLQKLYRHSSVTTTINYQANFIHKDADEALDAVVSF